MAVGDIFKTRKSAKLHKRAWQIIWARVKTPPAGDEAGKELHLVFVGTLLYATRLHAALAAGMEETTARAVALQVVAQAGFDEGMRDRVLSVFATTPDGRAGDFATALHSLAVAMVQQANQGRGEPQGRPEERLLDEIEELMPVLAKELVSAH